MSRLTENQIRILRSTDREDYESLLRLSFSATSDFTTNEATLKWTLTDDYYTVLGLFDNNRLSSMMRIEWISSLREAQYKLCDQDFYFLDQFPLGYMAKAASLPDFQRRGFNTILRYYALKIFQNWRVHGVLGTMVENSPRLSIMKKMGYTFTQKKGQWDGNFKSEKKVLIGFLEGSEKIDNAIKFIDSQFGCLLKNYKLAFDLTNIKMRPNISHTFPWEKNENLRSSVIKSKV